MKNIFSLLKRKRKQRSIPVSELANAVGYGNASIYRYENNQFKTIGFDKIAAIAVFLDIKINDVASALADDGYKHADIETVIALYRQELTYKLGSPALANTIMSNSSIPPDAATQHKPGNILKRINSKLTSNQTSTAHLAAVDYILNDLNHAEAQKSIKILKSIFD